MSSSKNYPLLRGGQQIEVKPVKNRFAIRPKKGVDVDELSNAMGCSVKQKIVHYNLAIVEVAEHARSMVKGQMDQQDRIDFTANMFNISGNADEELIMTDEITIQFKEDAVESAMESVLEEFDLVYIKAVKGIQNCYALKTSPNASDVLELTNKILEKEVVEWVEPNVLVKQQNFFVPDDGLFEQQWHLDHNGGLQLAPDAHVDATKAWDITKGNRSVVVAIVDDSVDIAHQDLSGPNKIVGPRDFRGRDFNPSPEDFEENHGTAVAGVAVAEANGTGVVGAAPDCALMPIRTSGYLDDNSIENIFDWAAENGADIISNSWGAAAINFPLSLRQSNAISRAANEGRNGKGCIILFAAGNSNRPVNGVVNETGWPNNQYEGPTRWLDGFAIHPDVIAVSACTSLNKKSAYSSWGKEISVCAPSNNGHPNIGFSLTYPRINGSFPGRGIVTTDRLGPSGYSSSDYTNNFGGTSSACPLAAGVAALILSANPELSAAEVRDVLESTADKIIDDSTDPQLGNAFGNYDANGHSLWFGYGKVNAYEAVLEAQRRFSGTDKPSEIVRFESTPLLPIPDNNPVGIVNSFEAQNQGVVEDLQVGVDISHTYIGDLIVELEAPSGRTVKLHDRTGGSTNNIIQTYTSEKFGELKSFIGETIRGQWSLRITDLAVRDTGILNAWDLVMEISPSSAQIITDEAGVLIPDADTAGIQRFIDFDRVGLIRSIKIGVDISHTFISDLLISLIAPNGQEIVLHDRQGGSDDNLNVVYSSSNLVALDQLRGQSANGRWALVAKDLATRDTGKLNVWSIEIELDQEDNQQA